MSRDGRRPNPTSRLRGARGGVRPGWQSWKALRVLLVALGLLVLQGPRQLHMLLVSHATCEHGDLIEVGRAHEGAAGNHDQAALDRSADHDTVEAADDSGSGHDHCDALALRHLPSHAEPYVGAPSLLVIEPLAVLAERAEQRPVPLLSLAPKSSPPAA